MDFHSPVPFDPFDSSRMKADSSEFHTEEYLEYRRRVYEELAAEYEKFGNADKHQQQYQADLISEIPGGYGITDIPDYPASPLSPTPEYSHSSSLHSTNSTVQNVLISLADTPEDLSPSQPTWDDSDLRTEPVVPSSPLFPQTFDESLEDLRTNLISFPQGNALNETGMSDIYSLKNNDFHGDANEDDTIPAMHWTELENQHKNMTKYHKDKSALEEEEKFKSQFSPSTRRRSSRSSLLKQQKDREMIRQKLSMGDPDIDSPQAFEKPWYQSRNNQNLQICYINDSCSSSESEDNGQNCYSSSKTSPSTKNSSSGGRVSPTSSPILSSPGFGMGKNFPLYRMQSSSSTVSLSSTSSTGHRTSLSSIPGDGEIISVRSSVQSEDIPKVKTRQQRLELEARIAITQAHQDARRLAEEERRQNRKGSRASMERLLQVPLDDATRLKVKTRALDEADCCAMTLGQLQVILNDMHTEKEALNSELKDILETRDELRTEQDAKLIDVEDVKAMMSLSGPETTV